MTFFNVSGGVDIDDIEVDGDDVAGKDVVVLEADGGGETSLGDLAFVGALRCSEGAG